jgi:integrase/recombinase XerD
MIALHYYAMLRVHEIAKIHGHDIDWNNRILHVYGKGKKLRHIPIGDELWSIIQDAPRDGFWFPNWKANRLYAAGEGHILPNSVSRVISDALARAGVSGHRPHDLRATGITEQVRHGVHILVIQQNAGHQSSETTQLYALVDMDQQRTGVNTITPVHLPQHSGRVHTLLVPSGPGLN